VETAPAGDARSRVRRHAATILGHRDATAVHDDASLFDLGLDSLMAADLARELSRAFGRDISIAQIFARPTVTGLADAVAGEPRASAPRQVPAGAARRAPRVAFLFSCQGSQYFGMGRELYDSEPVFRSRIDACDRILAPLLGRSLTDAMMHGDDPDAIHETRVTQPALVALQLALADLWQARGVTAAVVLGHSLGEVAAAIHAGVLDAASGLTLVAHRARLMQSTAHGAMLAVTAPLARITEQIAGTSLDIAAINGPDAVVVSGAHDQIEALAARLRAQGVTAHPIAVTLASHSRMMDPILGELNDAIAGLAFHPPRVPIIANLTGRLATAGEHTASYWCRHLREPVRFHDSARRLRELDIDACLEIGPSSTLVRLIAAAGLLPAGGGVASLQRGTGERESMLVAAKALAAHCQEPVNTEPASAQPSVKPEPTTAQPSALSSSTRMPRALAVRDPSLFVRPRPQDNPSVRLIAFHHAGGSAAMYHAMSAWLPADWDLLVLDLPGRGKRHAEPPISDVPELVARVIDDVYPWLDAPFALFGHSLGGMLAADTARACERLGTPPVWIGISGRVAPTIQMQTSHLSQLDDAALLAEIVALGGTPAGVGEHRELRERFLRVLRADLALLETYRAATDRAPLQCPITAFAGMSDDWAPPTTMRPWARETRGSFHLRLFPGGHFYFLGSGLGSGPGSNLGSGPGVGLEAGLAGLTRDIVREIDPLLEAPLLLSAAL
jgi:surfactin synthase thioesterase subunit/malonyl CoA-acyl carrier protein transacylase/aryl carrier-like protein